MESLLESLAQLMVTSSWLAPLLALLAGVVNSFTPCALSSVPLIVGYVGGTGENRTKSALGLSLTFALGSAVTFTALGVVATMVGGLLGAANWWWYMILGGGL